MADALMSTEKKLAIAKGLHELGDWLQAHPDVPMLWYDVPAIGVYATSFPDDGLGKLYKTSPGAVARLMKGGAKVHKRSYGETFNLSVEFSGGIQYSISLGRDAVCRPTRYESQEIVEVSCADEARKAELQAELAALEVRTVTGHRQVPVAFDCPPSLLAA